MTIIISALAMKGGATKTFTVTQLAAVCARAGLLTVVIDADMQANSGRTMGVDPTDGFESLISRGASWRDELVEVPYTFTNMKDHGLFVLPSGYQTSNLKKNPDTVPVLSEQIEMLRGWADVVLIDTSPGYDDIHAAVYKVSDYVILPTLMELDSVESLDQTFTLMNATADLGGSVPQILGIFPNRFQPKYGSNLMLHDALKILYRRDYTLLDPMLESVACLDSRNRCMSLFSHLECLSSGQRYGRRYDKRAASRAATNFMDAVGSRVLAMVAAKAVA